MNLKMALETAQDMGVSVGKVFWHKDSQSERFAVEGPKGTAHVCRVGKNARKCWTVQDSSGNNLQPQTKDWAILYAAEVVASPTWEKLLSELSSRKAEFEEVLVAISAVKMAVDNALKKMEETRIEVDSDGARIRGMIKERLFDAISPVLEWYPTTSRFERKK